jgi:hypothetical protein
MRQERVVLLSLFTVPAQPQFGAVRLLEETFGFGGIGDSDLRTGRLMKFGCDYVDGDHLGELTKRRGYGLNPRCAYPTPVL